MRFLATLFILFLSFPALAQSYYNGIPEQAPDPIHNLAIVYDECARTCDEPERTYHAQARDFLVSQFEGIDYSALDRATDTQEFIIGEALNGLTLSSIAQADSLANTGLPSGQQELASNNARSNVLNTIRIANTNTSSGAQRSLQGFNGEGFFLQKTVREIHDALRSLVFDKIYPEIGGILNGIFLTLMALWLTIFFVKMSFGVQQSWPTFAFTFVSFMMIVIIMQGNFSLFISWFADPSMRTAFGLSNWFVMQSGERFSSVFDSIIEGNSILNFMTILEFQWVRVIEVATSLFENISGGFSLQALALYFMGGVAYLGLVVSFSFTMTMFAFQIIYAIVAAFVVLTIAPIYMMFFPFPQTRGLFMAWIKAYANYLVIPVIGAVAVTVMVFSVENVIVDLEDFMDSTDSVANFPWSKYWALLILSFINGFIATRIGEIASSLVGGGPSMNLGRDIMQSVALVGTAVAGAAAAAGGAKAALSNNDQEGGGSSAPSASGIEE